MKIKVTIVFFNSITANYQCLSAVFLPMASDRAFKPETVTSCFTSELVKNSQLPW